MKNSDNRVRYTKMVLQQSLLRILQNKTIDKVTIKELCEEAELNRGTFYLHYNTPNDLLMEIEQQFIEENMVFTSLYFSSSSEASHLAGLFISILKNKEICRIIMGKYGNPRFLERIKELIRPNVVHSWCQEFPQYDSAQLYFAFDFVFRGSMSLILNWLEDEKSMSASELANRLDRLGHYCLLAVGEFGPNHADG